MGGAVATCVGGSGVTCRQSEGAWLHAGPSFVTVCAGRGCFLFRSSVTVGSEPLWLCTAAELLHGGPRVFVGFWTLGRRP